MKIEVIYFANEHLFRCTVTEEEFLAITPSRLWIVKFISSNDENAEVLWECREEEYKLRSVCVRNPGKMVVKIRNRVITIDPTITCDGKVVSREDTEGGTVVRGSNGYIIKHNREDVVKLSKAILEALLPVLLMMKFTNDARTIQGTVLKIMNDLLKEGKGS
jgi:hypothetical protein